MKIYKTDKENKSTEQVIVQYYFPKITINLLEFIIELEVNSTDQIYVLSELLLFNRYPYDNGFVKFDTTIPENTSNDDKLYIIEFTILRDTKRIIKQFIITQTLELAEFILCDSKLCEHYLLK